MSECDELRVVLRAVAAGLERRGVTGRFGVAKPSLVLGPPAVGPVVECRMRVRGVREHREPSVYRWHPDEAATAAVLAFAERWCRQDPSALVSFKTGTLARVAVGPDEDALGRLRDVPRYAHGELVAMAGERLRAVVIRGGAMDGISLVVGGVPREDAVAELTTVLRELAGDLVYGYVRLAWGLGQAHDDELLYDWPARVEAQPRGGGFTFLAFDDLFAPDAFGVQLLGPGYAGRIPQSPSWRRERIGDRTLLTHTDPDAWFAAPFVPIGQMLRPEQRPTPTVLADAREALAPILYTPGALHRGGYVEEEAL